MRKGSTPAQADPATDPQATVHAFIARLEATFTALRSDIAEVKVLTTEIVDIHREQQAVLVAGIAAANHIETL